MGHCLIPPARNMATIQTHHTQARAKSRSYSEPLFSLDPSFPSSSSSTCATTFSSCLISDLSFPHLRCFHLSLHPSLFSAWRNLFQSINQSLTHSSILLVSVMRYSVLLVTCQNRLSRSQPLEGQIKSSFLIFLPAAIAIRFIGCLPVTLACERGTGY